MSEQNIEYVIGIDIGHGETSAAYCPLSDMETVKDVEMGQNSKVLPSAITICDNGQAFVGEKAFDPNVLKQGTLYVCFKQKPHDINGQNEQLMIRYMAEVYKRIRESNPGAFTDNNHIVYIATPSGWDKKAQDLYLQMGKMAGMPMGGITKESRAAFISAQRDVSSGLGRNVKKGAVVFDMGSSTLDFTYLSSELENPIDFGYDCGASAIEKAIFNEKEAKDENLQIFEKKHSGMVNCILFEARRIKEKVYLQPELPVKKSINFDDIVEDDDLEDERVKFKFAPGELNQLLKQNGYIASIGNAMDDYMRNRISGHKIYGVFMTGGASRMDFLRDLLASHWNLDSSQIYRDTDPSLTISRGVAEVARLDLKTSDSTSGIDEEIERIIEDQEVWKLFAGGLCEEMNDAILQSIDKALQRFASAPGYPSSINQLMNVMNEGINKAVAESGAKACGYFNYALEEATGELRGKIESVVKYYSKDGMVVPELPEVELNDFNVDLNLSGIADTVCSQINVGDAAWVKYAVGGALLLLLGPLAGVAGYFGSKYFNNKKKGNEEQQRAKAMSKNLSMEEKNKVYDSIIQNKDEIQQQVWDSVKSAVIDGDEPFLTVQALTRYQLDNYKQALKDAKILID